MVHACAMHVEKVATVVPVDDLERAVRRWTALLGTEPTFVDGDRWAQFDIAGARIALAGTDRASDAVGLMLKVDDLDAARAAATQAGLTVGEVETGPHELRAVATGDAAPVVFYTPKG